MLSAQEPQLHAIGTDSGAGDVLVDLTLHDALLQRRQQRLGFGKAQAHTVGGEITTAAVQGAAPAGRHLAPAGSRLEHSMMAPADPPRVTSVSGLVAAAQVSPRGSPAPRPGSQSRC